MKNKVFPLLLLIICVGMLAAMVARGEEADPGEHPAMTDLGFSIGDYHFLFFPAKDQPLPHISGGFADYRSPQSAFHLPTFYMGRGPLTAQDLSPIVAAAGITPDMVNGKPKFAPHQISQLLDELDLHYKPVLEGKEVSGYYAIPTAAMIIRAVFDGENFDKEKWQADALADAPVIVDSIPEMLADRFSTDLNWAGEPQPDELTPTCETGRWNNLLCSKSVLPWPDRDEKETYLAYTVFRPSRDPRFPLGSPTKLRRVVSSFRLVYVPGKEGE